MKILVKPTAGEPIKLGHGRFIPAEAAPIEHDQVVAYLLQIGDLEEIEEPLPAEPVAAEPSPAAANLAATLAKSKLAQAAEPQGAPSVTATAAKEA
jgi:hypothetical protein